VNIQRAADLLAALSDAGVREFCVCPGGRNAPLVVVLARAGGITVRTFYEERAAAFFALGRIKADGAPVAVVTTSGTAAAELLPAAVEAYYAGLPLLLVTADRPPQHRGTGAPQTIDQVGLFGHYAPTIFDGNGADDRFSAAEWTGGQPAHVNICFDEPLVDGSIPVLPLAPAAWLPRPTSAAPAAPLANLLEGARRPLVILGPLEPADRSGVRDFLIRLDAPVYAEPSSGMREDPALDDLVVTSGEGALRAAEFDAVLRVGGVPALRFWRDLETTRQAVAVTSVSRLPFPGLTHGSLVHAAPGAALGALEPSGTVDHAWRDRLLARDRERRQALDRLCAAEVRAEPALIRQLSAWVPDGSLVYLGNSLPIREWDLAALRQHRAWRVGVNRGANGIDGQLSTFFGMCAGGRDNWAVVGDLTALYDLGAPWILDQLDPGRVRIVIVNNGGGQIFARLSPHAELRNAHRRTFDRWAAMWDLPHVRWDTVPPTPDLPERCVIELMPDPGDTAAFWHAYDALP
jgi:2-succinyl-5-enolpyruvyl-6-hydroxy-3-cyclohexene-1-carboxylate synthase